MNLAMEKREERKRWLKRKKERKTLLFALLTWSC